MSSIPLACIVYPLPILATTYGLKADKPLITLLGAIGWYAIGWQGTYIGILAIIGWAFVFSMLGLVFRRR